MQVVPIYNNVVSILMSKFLVYRFAACNIIVIVTGIYENSIVCRDLVHVKLEISVFGVFIKRSVIDVYRYSNIAGNLF